MKSAAFVLLLAFSLPASATLIAYDYEAVVVSIQDNVATSSNSSGTIIFDTSLLGIKKFTLDFDNHRLTWRSNTAYRLALTTKPGPIQYLVAAPGAGFDEVPESLSIVFQWEVYIPEPISTSSLLSSFNNYWSEETSPYIESPTSGELLFRDVSPAYQVFEPASLSLLALGLLAIGIRCRCW